MLLLRVVQGHGTVADVSQFDVLKLRLAKADYVRGALVLNLADHDRADERRRVVRTFTGAELLDGYRQVAAKSALGQGGEVPTLTGRHAANGNAIRRGRDRLHRAVTSGLAVGVRYREINRVAVRGVQAETGAARVEAALVKDGVTAGSNCCVLRNLEPRGSAGRVAQQPTAHVDLGVADVSNLDSVLERRVGVRQHLVDHHVEQRQVVARAGSGCVGKISIGRGTVRQSAPRDAVGLINDFHLVDWVATTAVEPQQFAATAQTKIDVVCTGLDIAIGHPAHPPSRGDERVFGDHKLRAADCGGIIRQRQAAQIYGGFGWVEQFKPIVAGGRVGHPLVDHQPKRVAKRCSGRVFRTGSRLVEQPPFAGALADRSIGNLETVLDRVRHEAVGVDEVKSPALCRERKSGVGGTRRAIAVAQHHKVAALGQACPGRERPADTVRRARKAHAVERHRFVRVIVNLHPVTGAGAIVREKLVEARAVKIRDNVWRTRSGAARELRPLGASVRQQPLGHTGALAIVAHRGKLDALGGD